jgi:hypothetical protein
MGSYCSCRSEILGSIVSREVKAANVFLTAAFRVGSNQTSRRGRNPPTKLPGYQLEIPGGRRVPDGDGDLVWDPSHTEARSPFFSVACVRLNLSPKLACWSVGTNPFIVQPSPPKYLQISEIWFSAYVRGVKGAAEQPTRLLQWDHIDLTLVRDDGNRESVSAVCLPRAAIPEESRKSAETRKKPTGKPAYRAQFARFKLNEDGVVEIQIQGQITLRANWIYNTRANLGPDDIGGAIHILTKRKR